MDRNKYKTILTVFVCCLLLAACRKEKVNIFHSDTSIVTMPGEGGDEKITFKSGDWEIEKVVNASGNVDISGNIYSADGDLVGENRHLDLTGEGLLQATWVGKGFKIERLSATSIRITLEENYTDEDFVFYIVLKGDKGTQRINVRQTPFQGYHVADISYSLEEEDGDSLFSLLKTPGYSFDIKSDKANVQVTVSPFQDIKRRIYFTVDDGFSFPWSIKDSVLVDIPSSIENDGTIRFDHEKAPYSSQEVEYNNKYQDVEETISVPTGRSDFNLKLEYHRYRFTYTLHLVNDESGKEKIIKGKWIEISPSGNYEVQWN